MNSTYCGYSEAGSCFLAAVRFLMLNVAVIYPMYPSNPSKQLPGQLSASSCWASSGFCGGPEAARIDSCLLPPSENTPATPPLLSHCLFLFSSVLLVTCLSETILSKHNIGNKCPLKSARVQSDVLKWPLASSWWLLYMKKKQENICNQAHHLLYEAVNF